MMRRFGDLIVAITGGARGIGLATAVALRQAGATVVIGDLHADALADAAKDGLDSRRLDVTDEASFADFIGGIESDYGRLDVLINNAGIMPVGPFTDYDASLIERTIDIDLIGVIRGCRLAAPGMIDRGSGRIINLASIAGRLPAPGLSLYNGAKFGVIGFTEALDAELRPRGVRTTAVLPSFTRTALIDGLDEKLAKKAATPEQVAKAIVRVIGRHRLHVYVPRSVALVGLTGLIPGRLRSWLFSRPSYAKIFSQPDEEKRRRYETEIRGRSIG